jgi:hypothetical protein
VSAFFEGFCRFFVRGGSCADEVRARVFYGHLRLPLHLPILPSHSLARFPLFMLSLLPSLFLPFPPLDLSSLFWGSFWFWFWLPTSTHLWLRVLPAGTSSGPGHCPCPSDGVVNRRYVRYFIFILPYSFFWTPSSELGSEWNDVGLSLPSLVSRLSTISSFVWNFLFI